MTKCIGRTASGKPIWSPLGEPYHLPDGYSPLTASEAIESGQRLAAALPDWSEQDHLGALRAMGHLRQETRDMQLGAACGLASVSHWFASATPTKLDESSGSRKEETKMEYVDGVPKHEQDGENVCPECGSENPPRATVCAECGAQLDNEEADVEEARRKSTKASLRAAQARHGVGVDEQTPAACPNCGARVRRFTAEGVELQGDVPPLAPVPGSSGKRAGSPPNPPAGDTVGGEAAKTSYCTNCGASLVPAPKLTAEEQQELEAMSPLLSKAMRSMGLAMVPIEEVADPGGRARAREPPGTTTTANIPTKTRTTAPLA